MRRYRNVPTDVSFRLPEFTITSYTDLSKLVAEFRRREDARMTVFLDGCIRIAENKYLTRQTSEMVRIFLGVERPEDLTQLDGYEIKQETFVDPNGLTWGTSNYRLIARSSETQPQEIPLCPDEPGVFYFETVTIRGGDRP